MDYSNFENTAETILYQEVLEEEENETILIKYEETFLRSYDILETSKKVNVFAVVGVIIIGLIGHFLTVFVFRQRRFRTNATNIYLLCLAVNDSLFLIIHFFEDTIRTYQDVFLIDYSGFKNSTANYALKDMVKLLNIADRFNFTCRMINYLRYVLRFISVNIIVAYTLQRLIIVISPFYNKYKSKKTAWITVSAITFTSLVINLWVPFVFELKNDEFKQYCDVKKSWKDQYFIIAVVYIVVTIGIPILIIFVSNSIIAFKTFKAESNREKLKTRTSVNYSKTETIFNSIAPPTQLKIDKKPMNKMVIPQRGQESTRSVTQMKPFYITINQLTNRKLNKNNNSKHVTKVLSMVSISFVILNMPYLITWYFFC